MDHDYLFLRGQMLKKIFLLSLLILSGIASAECGKFKCRWIQDHKTMENKENICIRGGRSFSPDCFPLIQKSCPFSAVKKIKNLAKLTQTTGSPAFNLCHELQGKPQSYEIKLGSGWKNFERCFWKEGTSFVDIQDLYGFYESL
jgi:hypothetical protein